MPKKKTTKKKTSTKPKTKPKKKAVKKKKTSGAKRQPAKKKRATSSSSKRSKKTAKKVAKKKTVSKRKVKVKKAELIVGAEPTLTTKASTVHKRIHRHNVVEKVVIPKKVRPSHFSFPDAINQIRDSLHREKPKLEEEPKTEVVVTPRKDKIDTLKARTHHSPYLLDLKRGKSHLFVNPTIPPKEKVEEQKKQVEKGFSALFTKKQTSGQSLTNRLASASDQLKPEHHVNLVPVRNGLSLRSFFTKKPKTVVQNSDEEHISFQAIPVSSLNTQTKAFRKRKKAKALEKASRKLTIPKITFKLRIPQLSWAKAATSFAGLCLLIALPIGGMSVFSYLQQAQGEVLGATSLALKQIESARVQAANKRFHEAAEEFAAAGQAFSATGALLENEYGDLKQLASYIPGISDTVQSADDLITIGEELSIAAEALSQGVDVFVSEDHFLASQPLSYKIEYWFVRMQEAMPHLQTAQSKLSAIDPNSLPDDVAEQVISLQTTLPVMTRHFERLSTLNEPILALLGHESMKRYMVMFQNNTELRATGGFMGSMALVDMDQGEITKMEVPAGGTYASQGQLLKYHKNPRAFWLINERQELQDANWFFSWPLSAEKIQYLYEESGGPSVDGVIAINTFVLEKLLGLTGSVTLEGQEISSENFREILRSTIEENKVLDEPKQIIADLTPILLERVKDLEGKEYIELGEVLSELLEQRDIQLQHNNDDVMLSFKEYGWAGEVVETPDDYDYLATVSTNLAGGKTDGLIKQTNKLYVAINENGKQTNTLTIRKEHQGKKGDGLLGVRNVDYLRVYVPFGSKFISAKGFEVPPSSLFTTPPESWEEDSDIASTQGIFSTDENSQTEIYTESGKTVFANWVQVDPGKSIEVEIVYEVPGSLSTYTLPSRDESWLDWFSGATVKEERSLRLYQLYWQKQSGVWDPEIDITVDYPFAWSLRSNGMQATSEKDGFWNLSMPLQEDQAFSWLFY